LIDFLFFYKVIYQLFFLTFAFICLSDLYYNSKNVQIDIDNEIKFNLYENDSNFLNYSSKLKPIAIYFPEVKNKTFSETDYILNVKKHIKIAENHGIYGFAIYYYFSSDEDISRNNEINIFYKNEKINFPFLFIFNNFCENFYFTIETKENFQLIENKIILIVKEISKYLLYKNYIKINNTPIILLENSLKLNNIDIILDLFRKILKKSRIDKIFIIYMYKGIDEFEKLSNLKYAEAFNGILDMSKFDIFNLNNSYYFSGIIYKNILFRNNNINKTCFRNSLIEINDNLNDNRLKYFTPEKYYTLNNIINNWTELNYNKTNGIFFVNSWNNFEKGNYLLPDQKYGFSTLNAFSKSLFKLPFNSEIYNLNYLKNRCIVAIQVHAYYEDLILEVINKTNNMPIPFDLFISTTTVEKKEYIDQIVKKNSKSNKYEIKLVENQGRDILPFLKQMKLKRRRYKYICHLHTKRHIFSVKLGNDWRQYLFENLLGSKSIISEIFYKFEKNENLGFIIPDTYYFLIKAKNNFESTNFIHHEPNKEWMNKILNILFQNFSVGKFLVFPSGDMFWAKTKAIHQIFKLLKFLKLFPKELGQDNGTILHGIERIWLYLVKINGFKYHLIFKHY